MGSPRLTPRKTYSPLFSLFHVEELIVGEHPALLFPTHSPLKGRRASYLIGELGGRNGMLTLALPPRKSAPEVLLCLSVVLVPKGRRDFRLCHWLGVKGCWGRWNIRKIVWPLTVTINKADLLDLHSLESICSLSDLDGEEKMLLMDSLESHQWVSTTLNYWTS